MELLKNEPRPWSSGVWPWLVSRPKLWLPPAILAAMIGGIGIASGATMGGRAAGAMVGGASGFGIGLVVTLQAVFVEWIFERTPVGDWVASAALFFSKLLAAIAALALLLLVVGGVVGLLLIGLRAL